jgi:hypothetical protein
VPMAMFAATIFQTIFASTVGLEGSVSELVACFASTEQEYLAFVTSARSCLTDVYQHFPAKTGGKEEIKSLGMALKEAFVDESHNVPDTLDEILEYVSKCASHRSGQFDPSKVSQLLMMACKRNLDLASYMEATCSKKLSLDLHSYLLLPYFRLGFYIHWITALLVDETIGNRNDWTQLLELCKEKAKFLQTPSLDTYIPRLDALKTEVSECIRPFCESGRALYCERDFQIQSSAAGSFKKVFTFLFNDYLVIATRIDQRCLWRDVFDLSQLELEDSQDGRNGVTSARGFRLKVVRDNAEVCHVNLMATSANDKVAWICLLLRHLHSLSAASDIFPPFNRGNLVLQQFESQEEQEHVLAPVAVGTDPTAVNAETPASPKTPKTPKTSKHSPPASVSSKMSKSKSRKAPSSAGSEIGTSLKEKEKEKEKEREKERAKLPRASAIANGSPTSSHASCEAKQAALSNEIAVLEAALEKEKKKRKKACSEVDSLTMSMQDWQAQAGSSDATVEECRMQIASLNSQVLQIPRLRKELESKDAELADCYELIDCLEVKLTEMEEQLIKWRNDYETAEGLKADLFKELEVRAELESSVESHKAGIQKLEGENATLSQSLSELLSHLQAANDLCEENDQKIKDSNEKLAAQEQINRRLDERIQNLEGQLASQNQTLSDQDQSGINAHESWLFASILSGALKLTAICALPEAVRLAVERIQDLEALTQNAGSGSPLKRPVAPPPKRPQRSPSGAPKIFRDAEVNTDLQPSGLWEQTSHATPAHSFAPAVPSLSSRSARSSSLHSPLGNLVGLQQWKADSIARLRQIIEEAESGSSHPNPRISQLARSVLHDLEVLVSPTKGFASSVATSKTLSATPERQSPVRDANNW